MTTTSRPVFLWIVGHDYTADAGKCATLVRSPKRWPRARQRAERRLWALCRSHGYDGPRDWQSILDWLRSIDWAALMKIVAAIVSLLITLL